MKSLLKVIMQRQIKLKAIIAEGLEKVAAAAKNLSAVTA